MHQSITTSFLINVYFSQRPKIWDLENVVIIVDDDEIVVAMKLCH